jgi:hypothetical protein
MMWYTVQQHEAKQSRGQRRRRSVCCRDGADLDVHAELSDPEDLLCHVEATQNPEFR